MSKQQKTSSPSSSPRAKSETALYTGKIGYNVRFAHMKHPKSYVAGDKDEEIFSITGLASVGNATVDERTAEILEDILRRIKG